MKHFDKIAMKISYWKKEGHSDAAIAKLLNDSHYTTLRGKPFTGSIVAWWRQAAFENDLEERRRSQLENSRLRSGYLESSQAQEQPSA